MAQIKTVIRRPIDEVKQVHPACFDYLLYNGFENWVWEFPINRVGEIDFLAEHPDYPNSKFIFECKANLYNMMALSKAAGQIITYMLALREKDKNSEFRLVLVAPYKTVYAEAQADLKEIYPNFKIEILELVILEKGFFTGNYNDSKKKTNMKMAQKNQIKDNIQKPLDNDELA